MNNYDKQLNIKLSTREQTALTSASTKHNVSKSQLTRSAIVNLNIHQEKKELILKLIIKATIMNIVPPHQNLDHTRDNIQKSSH